MEAKTDRHGNEIGLFQARHEVFDIADYPQVYSSVSKSQTTESIYVRYTNSDNDKTIVVRYSNHLNNAVECGDQLDGNKTNANEVLYYLGLKTREFIADKKLHIRYTQVKKKSVSDYEEAVLTISEIYNLGAGADLSAYKGKIAKGSNILIEGDTIEEQAVATRNSWGQTVYKGTYIYK